jgi:predicted DNA-binding protein YlxM (UPF0122 family)
VRKKIILDQKKVEKMYFKDRMSMREISLVFGVSASTILQHLKHTTNRTIPEAMEAHFERKKKLQGR